MKRGAFSAIVAVCALACSSIVETSKLPSPQEGRDLIQCEVAIVGGGIAGLYAAYRLSELHSGVCLFEAKVQLGGRVRDVTGPSGVLGVGARRFDEDHSLVRDLAIELEIDFQRGEAFTDRFVVAGNYARSKDAVARAAFPRLYAKYCLEVSNESCEASVVEDNIWERLEGETPTSGEDLETFYGRVLGSDELDFLIAVTGFKGDYRNQIDARSYLDWLDSELALSEDLNYPVGGMSRFVTGMATQARMRGARIFVNETVLRLDREPSIASSIRLTTRTFETSPSFVFLAVNAIALPEIRGSVVESIVKNPRFQNLAPVAAVVVSQWWDERWWENVPEQLKATRVLTTDHCIGRLEIPTDPFGRSSLAIRSVYNDDPECLATWEAAIAEDRVADEVAKGLSILFPGVKIPEPARTHSVIWRDAWYWQRGGTGFTNEEIARWAEEPLTDVPIALIGESYNPEYATWTDGAYRSALRALHRHFGIACDESLCPETP